MHMKVYAVATDYAPTFRGILEKNGYHVATLVFPMYDDLINFIAETDVKSVAILVHNQSSVAVGYRLYSTDMRDTLTLRSANKRGKKKNTDIFEA